MPMKIPSGWWNTYPSENMNSSVGIIIPNIWKVIKFMFQTTNQTILLFQILTIIRLLTID